MRFSLNKTNRTKNNGDMEVDEETFKREFEKAMQNGHVYGVTIKKAKRFRSAFTTEQVNYLEKEFRKYPYVGNARRKDVATVLNIPERAVKIWFQNRRMKEKKDNNKDSDTNKTSKIIDPLNNLGALQSTNDGSLPNLTTISPIFKEMSTVSSMTENHIHNDIASSCKMDVHCEQEVAIKPKISNNPTVIRRPASSTMVYPTSSTPYEKEKSKEEKRSQPVESSSNFPLSSTSNGYSEYKNEPQNLSFHSYSPPLLVPQDLSLKASSVQQVSQQEFSDMKFHQPEVPLYLKGFYAPPYISPTNMIWRPVNMASVVPTPVAMMPGPGCSQPNMKRNCTCDCHKPYTAPMIVNNQSSNLQYVVTAVPLQSTGPKF